MNIAVVQLNPVIGDFDNNCEKILDFAVRAYDQGCDAAIFPEMAVLGFPPLDLLRRPAFIEDHNRAMQKLVKALPEMDIILGGVDVVQDDEKTRLFNAAFVIRNGQIIQVVRKQVVFSNGILDESHYFHPGAAADFYRCGEKTFVVTVGEDIWDRDSDTYERHLLENYFATAKREGITIDGIINIAACHYQHGRTKIRQKVLASISRHYQVPLIYSNQVGGQDCLLFEGNSMVIDGKGAMCSELAFFKEDMHCVDLEKEKTGRECLQPINETAVLYQALVMGVADYVSKSGFSSVVLGLSGGIDSALTAAIAVDALGKDNVLGVSLPSEYSSRGSIDDAKALAANLGCAYNIIPICKLYDQFRVSLADIFAGLDEDITEQNLQARIRGNILMALSNKLGHLLLATGNKSEMAVGYSTLYGDMCGGLAVISDVYKQGVYQLAEYVNRKREIIPYTTISKPPSAELKPDQRDQDDLPAYEILDQILEMYIEKDMGRDDIVARGFDSRVVSDVLRRVKINEYKRKQAPMGLKITSRAFGCGRLYPNVQNYQE